MGESERVARRVMLWSLVAVGLGAGFGYLRIGVAPKDVVEIFGAKLAFLGLVVAAAGWRHVATALLASAAVPFGETLGRHVGALGLEFDAARRRFAAVARGGRLDDRAASR